MRLRRKLVLPLAAGAALTLIGGVVTGIAMAADTDGLTATYATGSAWEGGQTGGYTVTNKGEDTVDGWILTFSLPSGASIASLWNGTLASTGSTYTVTPADWNASLAPGASAQVGFTINSAAEVIPGDCLVNDHECAGSGDPGPVPTGSATDVPSTSPSATPTESPTTPPPGGGGDGTTVFAPYAYLSLAGRDSLVDIARNSGANALTLAFVLDSGGCDLKWDGTTALDTYKSEIDALKAAGVTPIVSTGGANGTELAVGCTDAVGVKTQLKRLLDLGITHFDFDVEGAAPADTAANSRRARAIAELQAENPAVKVSFTLASVPSDKWGTPGGVLAKDQGPWKAAIDAGVAIERVNVMAMNFGEYYDGGQGDTQMGELTINVAKELQKQIKEFHGVDDATAWSMVGLTPMIGANDNPKETFQLEDAHQLTDFAASTGVGMLSFWSATRDRACTSDGRPQPGCSNVDQEPYAFGKIFAAAQG